MKLCTFEVATHVGRHCRLGAFRSGRIVDLNFATAWYLAQQGEPEPQKLANALVPESDRVAVTTQRRDREQTELTIEYTVQGGPAAAALAWILGSVAGAVLLVLARR